MKHYEKIKEIRTDQKLTVREVYERGVAILGSRKAISISTINRIEAGKPHKFSSLVALCFLLNIPLKELFKGTEFEEYLVIRKKERTGGYAFSESASSAIINNPNQSFLAQEIVLLKGGETFLDHAPKNKGKYEKLVYVVSGQVVCVIDKEDGTKEEIILKGGDTLSFDGTKPHYFKNSFPSKCKLLVIENPGRY